MISDYTIKESPKAKSLRLKVTADEGLSVVIPKGFDQSRIPDILESKKTWLEAALKKAEENRKFFRPKPDDFLPEELRLQSIGQTWKIRYTTVDEPGIRVVSNPNKLELDLRSDRFEQSEVIARIIKILREQCRDHFSCQLLDYSEKHNLPINKISIRNQRTRWASCSSKRNVSLNMKLLFIRSELVQYVMIHELCHVQHMNHSKKFWRLVESIEPRYRIFDAELRDAWKNVPRWMF